jgi:serpin B
MRRFLPPSVLVLGTLALACGDASAPDLNPPGESVRSSKARITAPAPREDVAAAVRSANVLALELVRNLVAAGEENVILSPESISSALAMAYAGAAGGTHDAFEDAMSLTLPEPQYHRARNELDRQLRSRGEAARSTEMAFRLELVNQLFAQDGFPFEAQYLDTLAEEYGADVRLLDFRAEPGRSRERINAWVEDVTHELIRDLLPDGSIDALTRFVLVNAVSFRAAWETPFEAAETRDGSFQLLDGSSTPVPFMHRDEAPGRAGELDGVLVAALPYDGGELSMVFLRPPLGTFQAFEASLTAERLDALLATLAPDTLNVALPRFEIRTATSLEDPLRALGLDVAFTEAADFTRMSTAAELALTTAVHQAFIRVAEKGTEAAAATAIGGGVTSAPLSRPVALDRPFLFLVRDDATGAVLFLGRVVRP